jgi:poly(3-hydroxybutyrate) depolymerase
VWLGAFGLVVLLVLGLTVQRHRPGSPWLSGWFGPGPDDTRSEEELPDAATVAWCAPALKPIPGGGCFRAPRSEGPWPLILYLHGIFDPAAASDELDRQTRVANIGNSKGFAVLALRGHVGECLNPELASRVCWPSNEKNLDGGPSFVREWKTPLGLAAREGARGKRYVLGFSNGGYFSGLLAERAWFDAAAFVVARGGPVAPVTAEGAKVPILLTMSEEDPSYDEMVKLDEALTKDGWQHEKLETHGGHALPDGDIEAAVRFFLKQEEGK